ncbi:neuronal PAS domain-containing protein 2-like isoform X1 [Homalodisca vitripennis]|uniref:neuronal PAS domain-containing protein 2-like isoform X1 n=1 Tax=Homalodisca vitripennis TaxID=197043 RepID=UPI001EECC76F|nr:neuronal PAS domain-containing protein 2-like isoform X1 [Homalodisca vitripennis]
MEACKEEFITRHTLDGRIVYTDHRISTVAGYMAEEVCGVPGFQYMHKDDMRWTMVGLRQMFYRGSSYGQSCYRLQSKNGAFIYLKTCGYLELSENNKNFQSLICINSLVSVQEGETLMRQMKDLFSPVIRVNNDPNMEMLSNNIDMAESNTTTGQTEDPDIMAEEIKKMISNVPNQSAFLTNIPSPSSSSIGANEEGYGKVTLLAKAMPSLETHLSIAQERKKMEIVPTMIKTPAALAASLSPQSSHSHHSPPHPPTPPQLTPPPPVCPQQNRPSVLRVAHRQGDHVVLQPSVVKLKRLRTDEQGQEVVMSQASMSPHSVVVSPASSGGKRKSEDSNDWPSPLQVDVSSPASNVHAPTPAQPLSVSPPFQLETVAVEQLLTSVDDSVILPDFRMIPDEGSPPSLANNNLEDIELSDMYNFPFAWPPPAVPEMLDSSHRSLDSQIQLQQEQIHEIQQELDLVPPEHTNGQVYNTKLSQLQVEHRKQQQMLKTLQQDHQNIQHLGVCSNHQNVGI